MYIILVILTAFMLFYKQITMYKLLRKVTIKEDIESNERIKSIPYKAGFEEEEGEKLLDIVFLIILLITSMFYLISAIYIYNYFVRYIYLPACIFAIIIVARYWILLVRVNKSLKGYIKASRNMTTIESRIVYVFEIAYIILTIVALIKGQINT